MVKLIAQTPAAGTLPVTVGALTLSVVSPSSISAVMPFAGQNERLSADIGLTFPGPNATTIDGEKMAIWAGQNLALVLNTRVETEAGSVTDQSDAWAVFDLTGPLGPDALARLCPIDTRLAQFGPGQTARTMLGHMNASVTRLSDDRLRILVFRSMAKTAIHDLTRAMEHAQR